MRPLWMRGLTTSATRLRTVSIPRSSGVIAATNNFVSFAVTTRRRGLAATRPSRPPARPMSTVQPEWRAPPALPEPVQQRLPRLSVYNSLTRSKTPFVPRDREGKKVTWYACGPTVYDDSHLGHARNYVSTDIIRRILRNHFKFDVHFVMNITDVDDKIILAARQQHLLSQWLAQFSEVTPDVRDTTQQAYEAYVTKNLELMSADLVPDNFATAATAAYGHVLDGKSLANDQTPPGDKEAKVKMHLNTARSAAAALSSPGLSLADFSLHASGVLLPFIDAQKKDTVRGDDHDIFTKLTKRYEQRFFDDMRSLNVEAPDKVTRVTEYGPQIVDFVKQIQDNGFAYEHEGSVYYDINHWESNGGVYARLEPWNRGDRALLEDGEGSLSTNKTGFKRSAADFALWKASKSGEPSWPSPWGDGRPGWHIECSAMASDVLGQQFDIHSGGIDLAFPHHDNELAQSEAYWCNSHEGHMQWVNYFLHMGHLSIQGSKMSKSLKNFTTIREALAQGAWTPRSLRIVFLLGAWRDGLEITPDVVKAGTAWEERVSNVFLKVRDQQRQSAEAGSERATATKGVDDSNSLDQALFDAKERFDQALCDSFDTPTAMRVVSDLITAFNTEKSVQEGTAVAIGQWITEVVVMFGLDAQYQAGQMGWSGVDIAENAKAFVYPLSSLRDRVREQAKAGGIELDKLGNLKVTPSTTSNANGTDDAYAQAYAGFQQKIVDLHSSGAGSKEYLAICDELRDMTLWNLDIYLEDRDNQPALVRPLSQSLRQERAAREGLAAERAAAKAKAAADKALADKERLEKGKLSHLDMFRTSEFSEWDAEGLPTKDAEGKEVAKSRSKKLRKDWERQKKAHEAWLAAQK